MISERGIEHNPNKIKALLEMKPPSSYKDIRISGVLVRESDGVQKPIYYVSHVLHGSEENYPIIDKFAFALVISARKLKSYFKSYPIVVVTDQPLNRILTSAALFGRMTTWVVELSEFDHLCA
ncbi:hypothetical protein LIER_39536 [Lithospermum erythrorhizon]|uniref:Reverse transcriptase RNase H-like domain-containing protein n=1 Tax=Lithospermum erythrorhizon TaxID=34254 RepID=A0AAV3QKT4_LITER